MFRAAPIATAAGLMLALPTAALPVATVPAVDSQTMAKRIQTLRLRARMAALEGAAAEPRNAA